MKIFVSWSGSRSKAVAEILSDWLKCVIQASQPWVSTRDIDRGALWYSEINSALSEVTVGIVCLTQENKENPWILFETGALARGLSSSRVCTFLIDLTPTDVKDPLAQFNHTLPTADSLWKLVATINSSLGDKKLEEKVLQKVFDTYWPNFIDQFNDALTENPPHETIPPRAEEDILSEILTHVRGLSSRVKDLEYKHKVAASGLSREIFEVIDKSHGDEIQHLFQRCNRLAEMHGATILELSYENGLVHIAAKKDSAIERIEHTLKRMISKEGFTPVITLRTYSLEDTN